MVRARPMSRSLYVLAFPSFSSCQIHSLSICVLLIHSLPISVILVRHLGLAELWDFKGSRIDVKRCVFQDEKSEWELTHADCLRFVPTQEMQTKFRFVRLVERAFNKHLKPGKKKPWLNTLIVNMTSKQLVIILERQEKGARRTNLIKLMVPSVHVAVEVV